ncbi:uncharacterized protein LOC120172196 [Hibiscus syriacus]|uniref:uncharacterized protein LOC120172196 n=1 Tax=Hibiscus syriacus TaxID=106335 RepID=UPI0019231AD0|nr:uncharacterized protein LOC120172196 [Hibiscus syriacus]
MLPCMRSGIWKGLSEKLQKKSWIKKVKESSNIEMTSQPQAKGTKQHEKITTSVTEQELDVFLLGGDSDEGPEDEDEGFDDAFGKMADGLVSTVQFMNLILLLRICLIACDRVDLLKMMKVIGHK